MTFQAVVAKAKLALALNNEEDEMQERGQSARGLSVGFTSDAGTTSGLLVLDVGEKRILGVDMLPLLNGEFKLLMYLGRHACRWHSRYSLSVHVYERDDPAARQLVSKYASTLRKNLAKELPALIEVCRRRGYCCRQPIAVVEDEAGGEPARPALMRT